MIKIIDAVGKACPIPVIMTKKEIDNNEELIITKVDNKIAVENLKRLAASTEYSIEIKEEDGIFAVALSKECEACNEILEQLDTKKKSPLSDYVVFVGKEYIGEGSEELGKNLMRMFFYTLAESEDLPSSVLFMNGGVKLPALDDQVVEHLKKLQENGVNILVCGACLNFYAISDQLKVGAVSNMYEISEKMKQAGKVLTF